LLLAPAAEVVDHMVAVVVPVHLEQQQDFQYQLHQVLIQSLLVRVVVLEMMEVLNITHQILVLIYRDSQLDCKVDLHHLVL
jgi:hypothetical protein